MTFLCHTRYATVSESPHTSTVWKFKNFTNTQILREINFVNSTDLSSLIGNFDCGCSTVQCGSLAISKIFREIDFQLGSSTFLDELISRKFC